MAKISRKIVQSILQGEGKALTSLANSRVGRELRRTSIWNTSPSAQLIGRISRSINPNASYKVVSPIYDLAENLANKKIISPRQKENLDTIAWNLARKGYRAGKKVQSILNDAIQPIDNATAKQNQLIDVGILKATEKLLDKKLITPRQAHNVFQVVAEYSPLPAETRYGSLYRKTKKVKPILENSPFSQTNRSKKLSQISSKITNNYLVGRELIRRLGTAGLIGAGVAGAKALSSKSESKNKCSDVKKMANRSNKYFS